MGGKSGTENSPGTENNPGAASYTAIEAALVAIRRSQRRRTMAKRARESAPPESAAVPDSVFELLDAIEDAADRAAPMTVTELADALHVDQPRASRLTAQALDVRFIERVADQRDGRRSLLVLTDTGRAALDQVRRFRRGVIAEAIGHWAASDRDTFARLLNRFVEDYAATHRGPTQ